MNILRAKMEARDKVNYNQILILGGFFFVRLLSSKKAGY